MDKRLALPRDVLAKIAYADRTIPGMLASRISATPAHKVVQVSGIELDWSTIEHRSRGLAVALSAHGVVPGDVVGQMTGNTADHVAAIFAVGRLGSIECPINTKLRGESLRHVITHSQPRVLIIEAAFVETVTSVLTQAEMPKMIVLHGDEEFESSTGIDWSRLIDGEIRHVAVRPEDPAMLMYTSGTTGRAKGVLLPHHFVFSAAAVKIALWHLAKSDVLFTTLPLFHANARLSSLMTACVLNARAVVIDKFSASRFWDQVRTANATEVGTVGTVAPILLQRPVDPVDRHHRVRMIHGAGALSHEQRAEFEQRFGVRVVTGFAMTETSHFSTTSPEDPGRYRGAGRPVPGFEVGILDESDQRVPSSTAGEIAVRADSGYWMFLGYYRDPEATAAAQRNLWFHTGDIGYLDEDGYLHWVDRRKDAIRRKGEMISSTDVEEAALLYPGVAECAAIGVPGDLGEEEVKLVIRADADATIDFSALVDHCRSKLPDFAIPRYYELVTHLPRNATHKVEKTILRSNGISPSTWDANREIDAPRRDPGS